MVGGLKQIQVDSMSLVDGVGSQCIFPATFHKLAKFAMATTCAGWSNDETKALLGIWVGLASSYLRIRDNLQASVAF